MTDRYLANLAAVAHDLFDDETVLINFQRGTYCSLRDSAITIWAMAQTPVSLNEVLDGLSAVYGTLPPEAPAAVAAMLDRLCDEGCMLRTAAVAASPAPVPPPDGPFALPRLQTFRDLEDLVAIDPVHEANAATGWPNRPPSYAVER